MIRLTFTRPSSLTIADSFFLLSSPFISFSTSTEKKKNLIFHSQSFIHSFVYFSSRSAKTRPWRRRPSPSRPKSRITARTWPVEPRTRTSGAAPSRTPFNSSFTVSSTTVQCSQDLTNSVLTNQPGLTNRFLSSNIFLLNKTFGFNEYPGLTNNCLGPERFVKSGKHCTTSWPAFHSPLDFGLIDATNTHERTSLYITLLAFLPPFAPLFHLITSVCVWCRA